MRDGGDNFQELADETFAALKKRKQPVGLKAALKESVKKRGHKKGKALASAGALLQLFFYRQQRAHQQPRSGRHTKVRPSLHVGPATRHATESTGEKFLVAERRSTIPVIASAVKIPAISISAAASRANAHLRMIPSKKKRPRVRARGLEAR